MHTEEQISATSLHASWFIVIHIGYSFGCLQTLPTGLSMQVWPFYDTPWLRIREYLFAQHVCVFTPHVDPWLAVHLHPGVCAFMHVLHIMHVCAGPVSAVVLDDLFKGQPDTVSVLTGLQYIMCDLTCALLFVSLSSWPSLELP